MKKGIVFLGVSAVLLFTLALSFMLYSGDMNLQVQQKVLQQRKTLMVLKPSVISVNPQKAVLTQGGDPVVVEANGANLGVINSAQVIRAGNAVTEIEVTLDKSLLPTTLKVSLKASSIAPIAGDYQLAVFDTGNNKLLDVPTTILAIEVVAPIKKAVVAQKATTPIKATEPVQTQVQKAPITSIVKPGVTSVIPQKAVLTRGGEAVVVEAKGTNLTGVGSVQVTRAGSEAQGIEETLDKSQLPNALKVSLKASSQAPIANDYQLTIFDAGSQKLLDVPTAVLAIEVVASTTKTFATTTTRRPRQQVKLPQLAFEANGPDLIILSATEVPWSNISPLHHMMQITTKNIGGSPTTFLDGAAIVKYNARPSQGAWAEKRISAPSGGLYLISGAEWSCKEFTYFDEGLQNMTYTVDPNNVVAETNENNNTYTIAVPPPNPPKPIPDFTITSFKIEPASAPGTYFNITAVVKNVGAAESNCPNVEVNCSIGGKLGYLRAIPIGGTQTFVFPITWQLPPGTKTATCTVDPTNVCQESDENNNSATTTFVVQ